MNKLPFALPDIGQEEEQAVIAVLRSGWITTGAVARQFEESFAQTVEARHAVAVNSATAALHLSLEALGVKANDEVIVPTYTFAATAEVVLHLGARPILVDIAEHDFNIDAHQLRAAIGSKTKAVIAVHIAGLPADLEALGDICEKHGVPIVEDAAHAFPSRYHGKMIGSISPLTCFSFYPTKTMTTGEGGMICTEIDSFAERCRTMSLHGLSRTAWNRYISDGSWHYDIAAPGYKYNLTDIAAAIGMVQLRKSSAMHARRCEIAAHYNAAFQNNDCLELPAIGPEPASHAWHLYMLRLRCETLRISRDQFISQMSDRGITCSMHFTPLHLHTYYRKTFGYNPADFPVALRQYEREVSLPIYSRMTYADVCRVIEAVCEICESFRV